MDIGSNLAQGLLFQAAVWALLVAILWDLLFRSSFPLKNLAFFSVFIGLSGPQYHDFPNPLGTGSLLFTGALILLVHFWLHGGMTRYVTALIMFGFLPLIQFVGVMLVAGVIAGMIVAQALCRRPWREMAIAAVVPTLVAGIGYCLSIGSLHAFAVYIKSSSELASGYNVAMSISGSKLELLAALATVPVLIFALVLVAKSNRETALFLSCIFAAPFVVSMKHAIVRQDSHVVYIFSFVALAGAIVALATSLDSQRTSTLITTMVMVIGLMAFDVTELALPNVINSVSGSSAPYLAWHALRFADLRQELSDKEIEDIPTGVAIEPQIKAIIQDQPIASLSTWYSNAVMEDLNLVLYPVIQRYSAYTPYLDKLNADWVRDKGPRFLIFDGNSIDRRHPWTETPAMWAEVYRWYDTRLLGIHNLLLERRHDPRFTHFEPLTRQHLRSGEELLIPTSPQPLFWTMKCSLSTGGRLRAIFWKIDDVTMRVDKIGRRSRDFRVVLPVLSSPSIGNFLPNSLAEFAAVFASEQQQSFSVNKLKFAGPGMRAYSPDCDVQFLRPTL